MPSLSGIRAASPLDASDDSWLNHIQDTTPDVVSAALDNMPSDFASMDSGLQIQVERSLQAVRIDDTHTYGVRIVNGATILAADTAGGAYETTGTSTVLLIVDSTDTVTFSYVNTTATKADWDGASVEFEQTISKTKGWDGTGIRYDTVLLVGTYTGSSPQSVTLTTTLQGTQTLFAPTIAINVQPSLLDGTGTLFSPQVNITVPMDLLDGTGTLFDPTVTTTGGAQSVTLDALLDGTGTLFAPQVDLGVTAPLLDGTGTLFAPTVNLTVGAPLLDGTGTLFAPVINLTVTLDAVLTTGTVFAPEVEVGLRPHKHLRLLI